MGYATTNYRQGVWVGNRPQFVQDLLGFDHRCISFIFIFFMLYCVCFVRVQHSDHRTQTGWIVSDWTCSHIWMWYIYDCTASAVWTKFTSHVQCSYVRNLETRNYKLWLKNLPFVQWDVTLSLVSALLDCCVEGIFITLSSGGRSEVRVPYRTAPQDLTEIQCLVVGPVNRLRTRIYVPQVKYLLCSQAPNKKAAYTWHLWWKTYASLTMTNKVVSTTLNFMSNVSLQFPRKQLKFISNFLEIRRRIRNDWLPFKTIN